MSGPSSVGIVENGGPTPVTYTLVNTDKDHMVSFDNLVANRGATTGDQKDMPFAAILLGAPPNLGFGGTATAKETVTMEYFINPNDFSPRDQDSGTTTYTVIFSGTDNGMPVQVNQLTTDVTVADVPEPSPLVFSGILGSIAVACAWRQRHAKPAA